MHHIEETLTVSQTWLDTNPDDRMLLVRAFLNTNEKYRNIAAIEAADNGHVVLRIENAIPASERGLFLLNLEKELKDNVETGLTIWLEPVGDKSKLRQLRGVQVKTT